MQLDRAAVEGWLQGREGWEACRLVEARALTEGYSNQTWRLVLDGAPVPAAALRVQPSTGIFEPYDVVREAAVLERLAATEVPVPAVLGVERGDGALGAPFVLLAWVEAPHLGAGPEAGDPALIGAAFDSFLRTVVAIHDLDWEAAGLGFLGVPSSPAAAFERDLGQVVGRMSRLGVEDAVLVRAAGTLRERAPAGGRLALCQGDVNVFNHLVRDGEVVAVVDWEQARIGDPRYDLGQLLALGNLQGSPFVPADDEPLAAQLHERGGDRPEGLEPHRALWLLQLGVVHRAFTAQRGEQPWYAWTQVEALLERSLAALDR